ncbi:hypothetical protein EJV47_05915 [Hymenobacter gummosus]|uniref:Uncharacterized protein n=1 Tax=Hymenobacter gummosus TaxID=1776032 RepID=A0A431U775_9BACT|nr:hypothetical protein [Hymenobacter gummosus]RTQ52545.1 hypothetical protein EJV47_05915 [Hymenobacter gummosus]
MALLPLAAAAQAPAAVSPAQARAEAEAAAVRARAAAALQARTEAAKAGSFGAAPVANAQLAYGDYLCTLNAFDAASRRMNFIPKGTIQLNANGTYRYLDGGGVVGRYTYDTATRQISWITGYFAEHGPPKTTFTTTDKATQLDIEFGAAGGSTQTWSCGCNKK